MLTIDQIEEVYSRINNFLSSLPTGEEILNGSKKIIIEDYDIEDQVYMINQCVQVIGKYYKNNINILVVAKMTDLLNFLDQCNNETKLLTITLITEYYKFDETSFEDERWKTLYRQYRS